MLEHTNQHYIFLNEYKIRLNYKTKLYCYKIQSATKERERERERHEKELLANPLKFRPILWQTTQT